MAAHSARPIPIREFVALEKIAAKALRAGDVEAIDRVNERLADIDAQFVAHAGKLYIRNVISPKGSPDADPD